MTSPKSQNGSSRQSVCVLSASNAAHPPSEDCIPSTHWTPRSMADSRPARPDSQGHPPEGQDDLGGVVDVGSCRWRTRRPIHPVGGPTDGPVALDPDLFAQSQSVAARTAG